MTSRFDPLDMALGVLGKQPVVADQPSDSPTMNPITSNTSNLRRVPRTSSPPPKRSKRQLNVYVDDAAIQKLREAAIELGGQYSLGDIVERLIVVGLGQVVGEFSSAPGPTRLRGGRRFGQ